MRFKKNIKIAFLVIVFLLMTLLTWLNYIGQALLDGPHLAGGSINSMEIGVAPPIYYSIVFLIIFFCLSFWYLKSSRSVAIFLLVACFGFWMLTGRVVSVLEYPETRVYSGWFLIPNCEINLCLPTDDCETLMLYRSKVEKLSFWRLRVKNKNVNEIVFVGPFVWQAAVRVFNKSDVGLYSDRKLPRP